jgi:hypothetical protein
MESTVLITGFSLLLASLSLILVGAMKMRSAIPHRGTIADSQKRPVYPTDSTSLEQTAGPTSIPNPRNVRYLPMASPCLSGGAASLTVDIAVWLKLLAVKLFTAIASRKWV